jgi:septal ring factor EnvC (AmiA/AmiB activator)
MQSEWKWTVTRKRSLPWKLVALSAVVLCLCGFLALGARNEAAPPRDTETLDRLLALKREALGEWKEKVVDLQGNVNRLGEREAALKKQLAAMQSELEKLREGENKAAESPKPESEEKVERAAKHETTTKTVAATDSATTFSMAASKLAALLGAKTARSLPELLLGGAAATTAGKTVEEPKAEKETPSARDAAEPEKEPAAAESAKQKERIAQLSHDISNLETELEASGRSRISYVRTLNTALKFQKNLEQDMARLETEREQAQSLASARTGRPAAVAPEATPRPAAAQPPAVQPGDLDKGTGLDFLVREGTAIHTIADGTVKYAGEFRGYGNLVIVEHSDGTLSLYGFLKDIDVSAGQSIGAGKRVGRSGFIQDRDRAGFRFELRTVEGGRVKLLNPERWLPEGVDYKRRIMEGKS